MSYGEKAGPIGEWEDPFLIQRLNKPFGDARDLGPRIFAFGCGLKDGGLTKEAMDLLQEIFTFDYMGSAEFECGEVPRALQSLIISNADLSTKSFEIDMGDVSFEDWEKNHFKKPVKGVKKTVYLLAKTDHHEPAEKFIRTLIGEEEYRRFQEAPMFRTALLEPKDPKEGWSKRIAGWLDLSNKMFFFTDKDMFERTRDLFLGAPAKTL